LIADVVKGGPAQKVGLKKDDVVIGHQGKEIQDSAASATKWLKPPSARRRDSRSCVAAGKR